MKLTIAEIEIILTIMKMKLNRTDEEDNLIDSLCAEKGRLQRLNLICPQEDRKGID